MTHRTQSGKQAETAREHAGTEGRWHLSPKTGAGDKLELRCAPGEHGWGGAWQVVMRGCWSALRHKPPCHQPQFSALGLTL